MAMTEKPPPTRAAPGLGHYLGTALLTGENSAVYSNVHARPSQKKKRPRDAKRERRIVQLLAAGATVQGIAMVLRVEPVVVEVELREIRKNLGEDG